MEFLQLCLIYSFPHEEKVKKKVAWMIGELDADVRAGNLPFSEENLHTIQDVFGMTVKAKYEVDIIRKTKSLLAYFYEQVRRLDNKEKMIQQQNQEENMKDMSTQFPENEEVSNIATTTINTYFTSSCHLKADTGLLQYKRMFSQEKRDGDIFAEISVWITHKK